MADFTPSIVTPSLQGYTGQEPFRFWCQMALPLVYDDTLSYYELLNKVVVYLNNTISDVATAEENIQAINSATNTNIAALLQSYRQLQEYVNDYFTNLDVQQEINIKLDDMATSGELSNLLSPFIPDLVTNWLTANVNPVGSAVVVDSSLSISGAAADSKTVGTKFDNDKSNLLAINDSRAIFTGNFINGAIRESDGVLLTSGYEYRVASVDYFTIERNIILFVNNGYNARIAFYDDNNALIRVDGVSNNTLPLGIAAGSKIRITIRQNTENTSIIANIAQFRSQLWYYTLAGELSTELMEYFNKLCNFETNLTPSVSDWTNNQLINSVGQIIEYNGYFSTQNFIKKPDYCESVTIMYMGTTGYVAEYNAANQNNFVSRQQLAANSATVTTSAPYFRISLQGSTDTDYNKIFVVANDDMHTTVDSIQKHFIEQISQRVNVLALPRVYGNGSVIITSNDVTVGDTVYYKFTTDTVGYLELFDSSNVRILSIGKTATSVTDTEFTGYFIVPDRFDRVVVHRPINLVYLTGETPTNKSINFYSNNNQNTGFINGTLSSVTGELLIRGYGYRTVKRDINYTDVPIYVNVTDDNFRFSVAKYNKTNSGFEFVTDDFVNTVKNAFIPAHTYYRITIRRANENTAETANITEFESKIKIQNNILLDFPLTYTPSYITNAMSYRPLGVLNDGYICFSTDDGQKQLSTYTLPMFISKNVPLTMCLWSTSTVLNNPVGRAQILAAITDPKTVKNVTITTTPDGDVWEFGEIVNANYNNAVYPNIAQHGEYPWANGSQMNTPYNEKQLFDFWESEKTAFNNYGMTVSDAAACPYGYVNQRMIAQTGGYFGVNRSLYNPTDNNLVSYPFYSNGERSNIFALNAPNIKGYSMPTWKSAADYAKSKHYVLCVYLHDWDLTTTDRNDNITDDGDGTSWTAARRLESLIDYAKSIGLKFCNLSDIPHLPNLESHS